MANWTINSKTLKDTPATTDSIPIQEAGGTTKRTTPGNATGNIPLSNGTKCVNLYAMRSGWSDLVGVNSYDSASVNMLGTIQSFVATNGAGAYTFSFSPSCTSGSTLPPNITTWVNCLVIVFGNNTGYFSVTAWHGGDKKSWKIECVGGNFTGWKQLTDASGNPFFPVVATTASAANAYIAGSGNTILQSTSSAKYKTNIRDLEDTSTLDALRPVLYKSNPETVPGDDPTLDHYGFIAEELHEIDEKLVQYKEDEIGEKTPNGVQYDRVVVLLVKRIQELEARLAKAGI